MGDQCRRRGRSIAPLNPLVVVPAWNEAATLGATLQDITAAMPGVPVVVVDDGSTDGTGALARERGAIVLTLPFNLGVGAAMRTGFHYAVRAGHDAVVQIDADGQHDPAAADDLLAALSEADLVIGTRFGEGQGYDVHPLRRLAMRLLAAVVSALTRTRLSDTTSGFRASGPRAVALFAQEYPAEYLGDTVESTVVASRAGLRIAQVPVTMRPRQGGLPSQRSWQAALYLARAVIVVLLAAIRRPARP